MRLIAGYGPQECAPETVRENYRNCIEEQVERGFLSGCLVFIAEDSNAKLGPSWIPGDPHNISPNGKLLEKSIVRQNLHLLNGDQRCIGGPITRKRLVNGHIEESCIDIIMMCPNLLNHCVSVIIDNEEKFKFTKYSGKKVIPKLQKVTITLFLQN